MKVPASTTLNYGPVAQSTGYVLYRGTRYIPIQARNPEVARALFCSSPVQSNPLQFSFGLAQADMQGQAAIPSSV